MSDCIFCQISTGDIPSEKLYQDEDCYVVRDIQPSAPVHLLVIPHKHIASLMELSDQDQGLLDKLILVGRAMAIKEGIAEKGFKTVINTGKEGGQIIPHLHIHIMGGTPLAEGKGNC